MKYTFLSFVMAVSFILIVGCVPVNVLAPGAEQVKITQKPAHVAACTSVGRASL